MKVHLSDEFLCLAETADVVTVADPPRWFAGFSRQPFLHNQVEEG